MLPIPSTAAMSAMIKRVTTRLSGRARSPTPETLPRDRAGCLAT
jgi:hypothetical protein